MAWIYGIVNLKTEKIEYIGQTKGTIKYRFKNHKSGMIKMDVHMREVGIKNFKPVKLEECYERELDHLEYEWIRKMQPEYNVQYLNWYWTWQLGC